MNNTKQIFLILIIVLTTWGHSQTFVDKKEIVIKLEVCKKLWISQILFRNTGAMLGFKNITFAHKFTFIFT